MEGRPASARRGTASAWGLVIALGACSPEPSSGAGGGREREGRDGGAETGPDAPAADGAALDAAADSPGATYDAGDPPPFPAPAFAPPAACAAGGDRAWTPPELLDDDAQGGWLSAAIDREGAVHIAWLDRAEPDAWTARTVHAGSTGPSWTRQGLPTDRGSLELATDERGGMLLVGITGWSRWDAAAAEWSEPSPLVGPGPYLVETRFGLARAVWVTRYVCAFEAG